MAIDIHHHRPEMTTPESRAGATAIMAVAAELEQMLGDEQMQSCDEYFERRDTAVAAMLAAVGPLPDRAAGALRAVVDILVCQIQDEAEYDLSKFRPDAMLTTEQIHAKRQELYDRVHLETQVKNNVVLLHR